MTSTDNPSSDTPKPENLDPLYSHRGGRTVPAPGKPEPATWDRPEMRALLRRHDFTRVYQLLQRIGYSQQHIGRLTGQSQPEVSAIIHGRRILTYHLITRIAYGLGIPPGHVGTSWCNCQQQPTSEPTDRR